MYDILFSLKKFKLNEIGQEGCLIFKKVLYNLFFSKESNVGTMNTRVADPGVLVGFGSVF